MNGPMCIVAEVVEGLAGDIVAKGKLARSAAHQVEERRAHHPAE